MLSLICPHAEYYESCKKTEGKIYPPADPSLPGGMSSKDDGLALMGYLSARDETSIKNKLAGYKSWWSVNKTGSINLP
jgi:hypothetical protein